MIENIVFEKNLMGCAKVAIIMMNQAQITPMLTKIMIGNKNHTSMLDSVFKDFS